MRKTSLFFLISYLFLFPLPSTLFPILAATSNTISVSPQLIQLDLATDKSEAEYYYTNSTSQTIELTLTMNDVKELEDRGVPGLISPQESKNYKYGLSSWAKFSNNSIIVAPNETKKVIVFIDAQRLSIGGHYASVLAEVKQIDKKGPVKLRAILSSLLFVRQGNGSETEEAKVTDLKSEASFLEFPHSFTFRLNNTGNVDLTPHGRLSIKNSYGQEVAFGIVNEDSLIALPESIRKYTTKVKNKQAFIMPGLYTTTLTVKYGKKKLETSLRTTFISTGSVPRPLFGVGIIVIVLLIAGLFKLRRSGNRSK